MPHEGSSPSRRSCPVCGGTRGTGVHRQRFVLPDDHPLTNGYEVRCCSDCGFVFADTTVSQADYDVFYARFSKYEDGTTSTGGGTAPWDADRLRDTAAWIAKHFDDRDGSIVDVGCANGGLLMALKELGFHRLLGVDPSPQCVENTKRLGIDAAVGSLFDLSDVRSRGPFDLVILSHVLEHVQDVRGGVAAVASLLRDGGLLYVEVPDAARYAEFVHAPFQDFNTEHINHFSPAALRNLFRAGWLSRAAGRKNLLAAPGMPYPAAYILVEKTSRNHQAPVEMDDELPTRIEAYVSLSRSLLTRMDESLRRLLAIHDRVIVWGTGQLALKLLAETCLGNAPIAAFVDGNPINHGKVLRGLPIIGPKQIDDATSPILITTTLHAAAITRVIREDLRLPNPVFALSLDGSLNRV